MTTRHFRITRMTLHTSPSRPWAVGLMACGQMLIVSSSLLSIGCQGPLRFWRKDEPTIEQLLAAPQPWDAEQSRAGSNLSPQPAGSAARSNPNPSRSTSGNASSSNSQNGSNYNVSSRDPRLDEMSEEQLQAALAEVPANMRPLIKRQWEASRAHALAQKSQQKNGSGASPKSNTGETKDGETDIRLAALERQKEPSRNSGPAVYRFSDNDDSELVEGNLDPSDNPEFDLPKNPKMPGAKNGSDKKLAAGSVRQSLSDDSSGEREYGAPEAETTAARGNAMANAAEAMRKKVQNVSPPGAKKSSRPVPHTEAVDTGVEDDSLALLAAQSAHQPSDVVLASAASSRQSNDRAVAKASAESKAAGGGKGQVMPASSNASPSPSPRSSSSSSSSSSSDAQPLESTSPAPTTAYETARLMLRQLQEEGKQAADESPAQQLHRQAFERMLHVYLGELDPALRPIDGLQSHEQEYFRHQFQSLFSATDPKGNPDLARRWALVMENQRHAMTHLGAVSSLEVKNAAFCTNVDGYAAVTKFPTNQFKPGAELLLYCEVDNFVSEQVKDGYETKLQGSYHILDAGGARIADVLLPQEVDICKRPRRDYFFVYRIYLPQTIAPGRYQLQLSIEDMKGRKFGQSALDFQIAN